MRDMVQGKHQETAPTHFSNQTHDLKSLWNYFFDFGNESMAGLQPKIDVTEEEKDVLVTAEIPGIDEDKIDLKISEEGYLTISGEKEQKTEQTGANNYFQEISYGMFKRTIPLPFDLKYDMAEADYDNGVLNVRIPKSNEEKQKYKKISVKKKAQPEKNLQA